MALVRSRDRVRNYSVEQKAQGGSHNERLTIVESQILRPPIYVEIAIGAIIRGDGAGREAHTAAPTPWIDRNVVGEIDIAIAVRGDAIGGEPVVDTKQPVVLKIQSAFECADGVNALVVEEKLKQIGRRLDDGEIDVGQAEANARLKRSLDLCKASFVEPGDVALELGNVDHSTGKQPHRARHCFRLNLLAATDIHVADPTFDDTNMQNAFVEVLFGQEGDRGNLVTFGIAIVDRLQEPLQIGVVDFVSDEGRRQRIQLRQREELGMVKHDLLQNKSRAAARADNGRGRGRPDHGRPL